ncbi:MAG: hypothetical protein KAG43_01995 [Candidatus Marithrix sp.]|nr:hypothetical protein [Candidatus Marithrix sp.]
MKRRNFIKNALVIGGVSTFTAYPSTAFWSQPKSSQLYSKKIDTEDFLLSFWGTPHPTLKNYQEIVECGFNIATGSTSEPKFGQLQLELAEEVGIKFMLRDSRIYPNLPNESNWQQVVQQVIDDYADYPALYGYFIDDEPNSKQFTNLAKLVQEFRNRDPKSIGFINLFPNFASADQLGTSDYDEYVKKFVEIVKPPLISFDYYALLQPKNCVEQIKLIKENQYNLPFRSTDFSTSCNRLGYFPNLSTIRKYALESNTNFCSILLSTPHFNYRDPTPAEIRWQVYTSLAYGSRGIVYFTYFTYNESPERPTDNLGNAHNGILDQYGYRTSKFTTVRNINLGLQKLIPYLVKLTSVNIYQVYRNEQLSQYGIPVFPSTGGGMITQVIGGEFLLAEFIDPDLNGWLMIVNLDYQNSANAAIILRNTEASQVRYVSRTTGELTEFSKESSQGNTLYVWLAPGDGKLLRSLPKES